MKIKLQNKQPQCQLFDEKDNEIKLPLTAITIHTSVDEMVTAKMNMAVMHGVDVETDMIEYHYPGIGKIKGFVLADDNIHLLPEKKMQPIKEVLN